MWSLELQVGDEALGDRLRSLCSLEIEDGGFDWLKLYAGMSIYGVRQVALVTEIRSMGFIGWSVSLAIAVLGKETGTLLFFSSFLCYCDVGLFLVAETSSLITWHKLGRVTILDHLNLVF